MSTSNNNKRIIHLVIIYERTAANSEQHYGLKYKIEAALKIGRDVLSLIWPHLSPNSGTHAGSAAAAGNADLF